MSLIGKYTDINRNHLVLGADFLKSLKKRAYSTEELFQEFKRSKGVDLNSFLDLVTLLWLLDLVTLDKDVLSLNMTA